MTMTRKWRRGLVAAALTVATLGVIFVLAASRKESRWRVSFDLSNWRVYGSDSVEFDPDGRKLRSRKAYHLGPVVISSEQASTENKPASLLGTNVLQGP